MSDMSREEAIDWLCRLRSDFYIYMGGRIPKEGIKRFREALDFAISSIKTDEAYQLEYEKPEFCEDCISREAVEKITWEEPTYTDALNVLTEVRDKIRELPSVLPKADRHTGKWIPHIGMNHQCSVCGAYFPLSEFKTRPFHVNYCIECGARLESEDKE